MDAMDAMDAEVVAASVAAFFADRPRASLRLPSGWFGRPHDNCHELSGVHFNGDILQITLDEYQVITAKCDGPAMSEGRVLSIPVHGGNWIWTEYGGTKRHHESFDAGRIEFHAP